MHDPSRSRHQSIRRFVLNIWLAFSVAWAVAILVTDMTGGPLAIWIAATIVPVTLLCTRPGADNHSS